MDVTLGQAFVSELLGTGILVLLGAGVVANVLLPKNKGFNSGWIVISLGWGLGVFAGVFAAWRSGAHINPAVTIGIIANGQKEFAQGIPVNFTNTLVYFGGQMIGAMIGAFLAYLAYKKHFDEGAEPAATLSVFSTVPAIRSFGWNLVTEILGTFVLVYIILEFGNSPHELGPLAVALLVVAIGLSLGGPTGYAINPARDLGPRIIHAILPIKGKGPSDWRYAWVPVIGPLIGGALGGLLAAGVA